MLTLEFIAIACSSTAAFLVGGWFLLRARRLEPTLRARLLGLASFAAAGFLLSLAGLKSNPSQLAELANFTRSGVGFYLLFCGLAPWCASGAGIARPSLSLVLYSSAVGLLLIANQRSEFSLLHESFTLVQNADTGVVELERLTSAWAVSLAACVFACFALLAKSAYRLASDDQGGRGRTLGATAFLLPATFFWDFALLTGKDESSHLKWTGVAALLCVLASQAIGERRRDAASGPSTRAFHRPSDEDSARADPPEKLESWVALLLGFSRFDEQLLSKLLGSRGYIVMQEPCVERALQAFIDEHPDCRLVAYDLEAAETAPPQVLARLLDEPLRSRSLAYSKELDSPVTRRKLRSQRLPRARELFQALDALQDGEAPVSLPPGPRPRKRA